MNRKIQAQQLYMQGATQKEIAEAVGVSGRTIWTWIHQYAWDKLRLAAYQAPAIIADNFCSQIVELQNVIAARAPGSRYPTMQEAEILRKLTTMLEKTKKTPSLSQNMQMLETFRNYVRPIDPEFARNLAGYALNYLEGQSMNGYAPYQPEYGVEPVPPVMPFFPETEEDDTVERVPWHAGREKCYTIPSLHYQQQQDVAAANLSVQVEENSQLAEATHATHVEEKSQPTEVPHATHVEEKSQLPEARNSAEQQPVFSSATTSGATPVRTSPAKKIFRSRFRPHNVDQPNISASQTGSEPEDFSQLAPTG